ncbi:MAG: methyltransferase domain-containing protein [Bacteroidia bacterium]|nr:methyltransferase domain-containing protein [Bacteroidia bacterium]
MFLSFIRPIYLIAHRILLATRGINPLFIRRWGGFPVGEGHIGDEHLADPHLDDQLEATFTQMGVSVYPWDIDPDGYAAWLQRAPYPDGYYGGGLDPAANFTEKSLEHYVSTAFIPAGPDVTLIDIAACNSPFADIMRNQYGCKKVYQQDLIYPKGIHGDRIGGWGHELYLPGNSVDGVTLHCSLEHFEGNSDTLFFQEISRVLKPGGRVVILPFYLAHTYTIHVDPAYNLLKRHTPQLDPEARLRYAGWRQFFSRHYDPAALYRRVLAAAPSLRLTLYRVRNFREIYPGSYLRWIGVFEKQA